jgi:hypothetical protein
MQPGWGLESYQRWRPFPWDNSSAGPCKKCGQMNCCCRDCRKEARSLLAVDTATKGDRTQLPAGMAEFLNQNAVSQDANLTATNGTVQTDFIGGECCVTLSVEYAATVATAAFLVLVYVVDSEGTVLAWARTEKAGTSYRTHECIITTKPGAKLTVAAVNCSARVRWCEVFAC